MPVSTPDYSVFRESLATPLAPEAFEYSLGRWISQIPEEEGLVRKAFVPLITETSHLLSERCKWRPAEFYFWDAYYWSQFFRGDGHALYARNAMKYSLPIEEFSQRWLHWYEIYKSIEVRHPRVGLTALLRLICDTEFAGYPKERELISRWLESEDAKPPYEERSFPVPPDFKQRVRSVFNEVGDWWPRL